MPTDRLAGGLFNAIGSYPPHTVAPTLAGAHSAWGSGSGFGPGHLTYLPDTGRHPDRAESRLLFILPLGLGRRTGGRDSAADPRASSYVAAHGPVIFAHAHQPPLPWTCTCKSAVSWIAYLANEK